MITQKIQSILQNLMQKNDFNEHIDIVAVTKKQPITNIYQTISAGISTIAESTVQEFLQKYTELSNLSPTFFTDKNTNNSSTFTLKNDKIHYHFIGKLQRNKVKYLVHKIDLLHSLDCLSLAYEIEKQGIKNNWYCPSLLQINIAKEPTKNGFFIEELENVLKIIEQLPHVKLAGLMAILPKLSTDRQLEQYAKQMRSLFEELHRQNRNIQHLSMGMSRDYKICIDAGSNMVRLGTLIYGER